MSAATRPLPEAMNMTGKRVLVTGAASGIGRASARILGELGADLVLCDRAPLGEVRAELEAAGVNCTEAQGDLASDEFVAGLLGGGRLHAVAHCAAILDNKYWREDANWHERLHRVMDINVRVPLQLAQATRCEVSELASLTQRLQQLRTQLLGAADDAPAEAH